jgi:hypothetical protein
MWLDQILAEGEHAGRMQSDLEYFARHALKLRPKLGPLEPFLFNAAQRKLHEIIEGQKAKIGRVRVIVLKARQLGVSTYTAARFYHRTVNSPGLRCIIIGHERRASSNLFEIVKRFHEHMPDDIKSSTGTSNAEELLFDRLDGGYVVSVAAGEGAGRSATAQLLHASESAFWADLPLQMASLMQTVPDVDGSEIIIESTANGYNDFHSLWRKAEAGESEFMPAFLPWSLDPGYSREVGPDFRWTPSNLLWRSYKDLAKNRSLGAEPKSHSSGAANTSHRNIRWLRLRRSFPVTSTALSLQRWSSQRDGRRPKPSDRS